MTDILLACILLTLLLHTAQRGRYARRLESTFKKHTDALKVHADALDELRMVVQEARVDLHSVQTYGLRLQK